MTNGELGKLGLSLIGFQSLFRGGYRQKPGDGIWNAKPRTHARQRMVATTFPADGPDPYNRLSFQVPEAGNDSKKKSKSQLPICRRAFRDLGQLVLLAEKNVE